MALMVTNNRLTKRVFDSAVSNVDVAVDSNEEWYKYPQDKKT